MSFKLLEHIAPYHNVVWDWNGTLLNDRDVVLKAEEKQFRFYRVEPPSAEKRHEIFCFPLKKYYEKVGFDFEKHDFESVNRRFMEIYDELLAEAPLFQGTKE